MQKCAIWYPGQLWFQTNMGQGGQQQKSWCLAPLGHYWSSDQILTFCWDLHGKILSHYVYHIPESSKTQSISNYSLKYHVWFRGMQRWWQTLSERDFLPSGKVAEGERAKKTILAKQIVSVSPCGCGKITSAGTGSIRNPDKPEVNAVELLA